MKTVRMIALGALLAAASTAAVAFQEQQGGGAPSAGPAPAAPTAAGSNGAALNSAAEPTKPGVEIRIPGLGQLGVLPKLDLGLELLYGATETKGSDSPAVGGSSDDMAIRGTLRRRF